MLKRLSVENYALIDKLDIAFAPGLNIITGETGAGKSILLGALGLILGNRGDVAAIRDAQRNCVIEAEFDLSGYRLEGLFASFDIDYDQQCMIRRVITPAGKSRAYVNDLPVQLAALRAIGERLIDIHSQHQTLLLGESRFQTALLDSVAAHAQLPTIIFYEIDTGVSGAIADKMGEIITNLSGSLQVVNITHLPQVDSKGDHHFLVYKEETPEGTLSRIRKLSSEARVAEIAKMLSGSAVTAAATEQARLLLGMEKL